MVAEITGILVVLPRAMHTPLISIELWIPGAGGAVGKHGLDSGLDSGLHFGLDFGLDFFFFFFCENRFLSTMKNIEL